MLEYHAAYYLEADNSGWYTAQVLDFPGVISQGKTLRSAQRMVRDALQLMADDYLLEGKPLPAPNPKARDKKADFQESIRLSIRVHAPARS